MRCSYGAWSYGSTTLLPTFDSDTSDPPSLDINVEADGGVIAAVTVTSASSFTWTGVDEDYDTAVEGGILHSGGSRNFASAQTGHTVTATPDVAANNRAMIVGAFKGD